MLASIVVTLRAVAAGRLPLSNGYCVHSAFLARIERRSPALARELGGERGKASTVSPLLGGRRADAEHVAFGAGEHCALRFTALRADVADAIVTSCSDGKPFELLGNTFDVVEACTHGSHGWAGMESYQSLVDRTSAHSGGNPSAAGAVWLELATPTAFDDVRIPKRVLPLPIPERIFGGLADRWTRFAPAPLAGLVAEWVSTPGHGGTTPPERVLLQQHDIHTRMLDFGDKGRHVGFEGTVAFAAPKDFSAHDRAVLRLLAAFARYAGVGDRTMWGMGQARQIAPPVTTGPRTRDTAARRADAARPPAPARR